MHDHVSVKSFLLTRLSVTQSFVTTYIINGCNEIEIISMSNYVLNYPL